MPLPVTHPVEKTGIELRRAVNRLINHKSLNPSDPLVTDGTIDQLVAILKSARKVIPKQLLDTDINGLGGSDNGSKNRSPLDLPEHDER